MHYTTMLWSAVAAVSLVLSAIQLSVWTLDRRAWASLTFAVTAFGVAGVAWCELAMMDARSPQQWGEWIRWFHIPIFVMMVGLLAYVRTYLGAGRLWLLGLIACSRAVILATNFLVEPNFNFQSIDSIARIRWLGEWVTIVDRATTAQRQWGATLTTILLFAYIVDACVVAWRTGSSENRRRTLVFGTGVSLFFIPAIVNFQLVIWGVWRTPLLIAPPFLIALGAMGFEMSREILRASRLAAELRESERALQLAASAGGLGLWSWNAHTGEVWTTAEGLTMFGLEKSTPLAPAALAHMIAPEDLAHIDECVKSLKQSETEQELQFRIHTSNGSTRWILARGRGEFEPQGQIARIRGVVRDVTAQHKTMHEIEDLRANVAHSSRVTALGHLSFALAHELRQPLAAMQSNIESAQMVMQRPDPFDPAEVEGILSDIRRDSQRAADVIDRMRSLMNRHEVEQFPIAMEGIVQDVAALVRTDAIRRGVALQIRLEGNSLTVLGDRVHLSQVLINLILNAMDAMSATPPAQRRSTIGARRNDDGRIEVSVTDSGPGIATETFARLFDPFFTTKPFGMGIGLSICRMIVESHNGRLWAENNPAGGATFRVSLPPHFA
jgi:two-component system sensor kinase FixL